MNRRTYKVIIERLRYFADNHDIINRFSHGQIDLSDLGKDTPYPYMHVVPETFDTAIGQVTYNFTVFFFDMPRDKSDKSEYQAEALSDCSQLALDLLATINGNPNLFGAEVDLLDIQGSITPFMEEMKHVLTGVTLSLGIVVPYDYDWCTVPGSYAPGGSGSGGSGSSGVTFAQSLVLTNGVVTFVNDEDAPGNSEYYGTNNLGAKGWYPLPGGGGGAVDSVNGQTGVVVLNAGNVGAYTIAQTDSAIDAEASTRGAADTALANALDTESTERQSADALLMRKSNNLSDVADAATSRSNLGLGNVTNHAQTQAAIVPNTAPAVNEVLMGNAGGTAYEKKTLAEVRTALGMPTRVILGADYINDNAVANTLEDITGLSFAVVSGGSYFWEATIWFVPNITSNGARWSASGPAGNAVHSYLAPTTVTGHAVINSQTYGGPSAASSTTASATANGNIVTVRGFVSATADGTVQLQVASEEAGPSQITVRAGSFIKYERVV